MITQSNIRVLPVTTKHGIKNVLFIDSITKTHTYHHHHHGMSLSSSTFSDGIFSQPTLYSPTSKAKHIIKHCNVVHNPNMSRSMLFVFLLPYIPVSKTLFLILCISWLLNLFTGSFLSFSSHTLSLTQKV